MHACILHVDSKSVFPSIPVHVIQQFVLVAVVVMVIDCHFRVRWHVHARMHMPNAWRCEAHTPTYRDTGNTEYHASGRRYELVSNKVRQRTSRSFGRCRALNETKVHQFSPHCVFCLSLLGRVCWVSVLLSAPRGCCRRFPSGVGPGPRNMYPFLSF